MEGAYQIFDSYFPKGILPYNMGEEVSESELWSMFCERIVNPVLSTLSANAIEWQDQELTDTIELTKACLQEKGEKASCWSGIWQTLKCC